MNTKDKYVVIIDEIPQVVNRTKALQILHLSYDVIDYRLRKANTYEKALKYQICKVEDYERWTNQILVPKVIDRGTRVETDDIMEYYYCNGGCGQLITHCMCDKFDSFILNLKQWKS